MQLIHHPLLPALKRLMAARVHIECCPTSSLLTKSFVKDEGDGKSGWENHPIARFVRDGMSVSLSTDDPKVFDIDYKHEVG